jgi:hypothetical protein
MVRLSSIVALSALTLAASANAGILLESQLPTNTNNAVFMIDGITVTASSAPRNFARKTINGFTGVGVAGGNVNAEIDSNESITFTFSSAVNINSLSIAFLYADGNFNDVGNESAHIFGDANKQVLAVTSINTGTWSGSGTLTNDSASSNAGGGAWTVSGTDIFGGAVTQVTLRPGNQGPNATFGDYSFRSISFTAVPAPGAGALAGMGLLSIGRRARRTK